MLIEYLLFIGSGLYLASAIIFLYLFLRTFRTKDGIGLVFLKFLTGSLSLGSFVVLGIRVCSEYWNLDMLVARAIAVVMPGLLVMVALYLNYLFHQKDTKLSNKDIKNIKDIKVDVKKIKSDVSDVKEEIVK